MGEVIASASMSLDGYIAKQDNTIGRLFDWLENGDVEFPTVDERITFHMSAPSVEYWGKWVGGLGALVCGRTLFDFTDGWGGTHTMGVPVVVVTHHVPTDWVEAHAAAPFHFVTDGVEAAVVRRRRSLARTPWRWQPAPSPVSASNSVCSTRSPSTWCLS